MIQISRTAGRKYITLNTKKGLYSNTTSEKQYLPDSGRFIPYRSGQDTKASLQLTNELTSKVVSIPLNVLEETERSVTYFFEFIPSILSQKGVYNYIIIENIQDNTGKKSSDWFFTDKGLFVMYNDDTFTEPYITPDVEVIPATKVYKPL